MPQTMFVPQYVKTGLAGYGPDLEPEDEPYGSLRDACEAIREELSAAGDSLAQSADALAESGDYESAWHASKYVGTLETMRANLDYDTRADAPIYRDDAPALEGSLARIIAESFPFDLDPDGRTRLYVWDAPAVACRHCSRAIWLMDGKWVDPEATDDDAIWRETCDAHDTFTAEHEPAED